MNEKDPSGRECNANAKGYRGESGSWPYPTRKQGSVLTNQCLGKERMLSEELRNPSFLTDSDELIVERHRVAKPYMAARVDVEDPRSNLKCQPVSIADRS